MKQIQQSGAWGIALLAAATAASAGACDEAGKSQTNSGESGAGQSSGSSGDTQHAGEPAVAGGGGGSAGSGGSPGTAGSPDDDGGRAGAEHGDGGAGPELLGCKDDLKQLDLGPNAEVTLVHSFEPGDVLALTTPPPDDAPITPEKLCLVKVIVGPGNPGPDDAPSTSRGIGIEIWLPDHAKWNGRYQALGGGGLVGGPDISSLTAIGALRPGPSALMLAGDDGYVTSINDGGHTNFDGSFAMLPSGELNSASLVDFGERATHEMALKTKALIRAFYGKSPTYSYFQGCSEGGREALMEVQRHPTDFDGVIAGAPPLSLNLDLLWPQIVMRVDLGGPIAGAKLATVTTAANAACNQALTGQTDGYVTDPSRCRYDPTQDAEILCVAAGGTSTSATCLTVAEANAVNKIWYGPTLTGAVPAPAVDNGRGALGVLAAGQLGFGLERGALLAGHFIWDGVAGQTPSPLGTDVLALTLGDPAYAQPSFMNATGNGQDEWQTLGYAAFADAYEQAQDAFDDLVGVVEPDLSAFSAHGGRLVLWHGTSDTLVPPHGSVRYYESVAQAAGGYTNAQEFARFYLAPGFDHCFGAGVPGTNPPAPGLDGDPGSALFEALVTWVEQDEAPEQLDARSAPDASPPRHRPWCLYPKNLRYVSGDVNTGSFACE